MSTTSATAQPMAIADRDQPAGVQPAGDDRVAPGRRHDGPGDRPQPDRDEEQPAVAPPERAEHQRDGQAARIASVAMPS